MAVSSQPPGQDGSGRGEGLSPGWVVPPAEAPGSLSPTRSRTPPRTCSGLRPPEEGRAQASRKVKEQGEEKGERGEGRPHPGAGGPAPFRLAFGRGWGTWPLLRIPAGPYAVGAAYTRRTFCTPVCLPCALELCVSVPAPVGWRVRASPLRLGPSQAQGRVGRGGCAWCLRAVAQPPGSRSWAGPPLAKVAQRLFPATEVLFGPTGCLYPNRSPRPSLRIPLVFH